MPGLFDMSLFISHVDGLVQDCSITSALALLPDSPRASIDILITSSPINAFRVSLYESSHRSIDACLLLANSRFVNDLVRHVAHMTTLHWFLTAQLIIYNTARNEGTIDRYSTLPRMLRSAQILLYNISNSEKPAEGYGCNYGFFNGWHAP